MIFPTIPCCISSLWKLQFPYYRDLINGIQNKMNYELLEVRKEERNHGAEMLSIVGTALGVESLGHQHE